MSNAGTVNTNIVSMPDFSLTSIWLIPAPVEDVWSCLVETDAWPNWWKYVEAVEETAPGEPSGLNNIRHYYWHTCLPYCLTLSLRVTKIDPRHLVAVEVSGDLKGDGCCQLSYQPSAAQTRVVFHWNVQTCKPWMNWFTALTRPVFTWNHNRVMKQGEQGLIRHLAYRKQSF